MVKVLPHVIRNINEFNIPSDDEYGYEILYFLYMKEDITRGGNLVHLFVISASIGILLLYPILVPNFTSASKNALFAYAVDIESLIEQGNAAYDEGRSEEAKRRRQRRR